MISYIKGKILIKKDKFLVLERQGIGYKIFVSAKTLEKIKLGEDREFFTFFTLRKEKLELYGFLTQDELTVFEIIEKISGIGPKGAMLVASIGTIDELKSAVEAHSFKYFSDIKGLGKKKIQKIILELGGSLKEFNKSSIKSDDQALRGLSALGFPTKEAKEILEKIPEDIKEPEKRIQKALEILGRND
ncbi:MAG: Holliday junction branch migration protein RuvA [Patescibacteria group bacterium]|nr:Holliday junction branch migration protein RuvA [Patescibacteria group bacterium]